MFFALYDSERISSRRADRDDRNDGSTGRIALSCAIHAGCRPPPGRAYDTVRRRRVGRRIRLGARDNIITSALGSRLPSGRRSAACGRAHDCGPDTKRVLYDLASGLRVRPCWNGISTCVAELIISATRHGGGPRGARDGRFETVAP